VLLRSVDFDADVAVPMTATQTSAIGDRFEFTSENDTCIDGDTVLNGSQDFTVKAIEVFEITD
jgi:hypothetical protein